MSILNKYKRWIPQLVPLRDEYWDFVLSQDDSPSVYYGSELSTKCLSAYVDFSNRNSVNNGFATSLSEYTWDDAVNNGLELKNIGYTGIDNGLIYYGGWDKVSNKEFYNYFVNSTFEIGSGDTALKLHAVTGNTGVYSYDYEEVNSGESYYALKGGFFQGFYKIFGNTYQVLPQGIENSWHLEFVIRPKSYEEKDNTLNKTHEGNDGIFFYMGTRAENKFAQLYNCDLSKYESRVQPQRDICEKIIDGYGYLSDSQKEYNETLKTNKDYNKQQAWWLEYFLNRYGFSEYNQCGCGKVKPVSGDTEPVESGDCSNYEFDPEYFEEDICISGLTLTTADGAPLEESGYYEIKTDNKFLTFNRTKYGFTTATWDEDTVVILTGVTRNPKDNLFLIMNRTCCGYTTSTIDKYYDENPNEYKLLPNIEGNSFALKYNSDGSVSYRYLIKDCENDNGYSILEESTLPGLIKEDKWNVIHVAIDSMNGVLDDCGYSKGGGKIKIKIYVNGYLKFVSRELPEFNFRELNDIAEKQEGVPFNISIGGGTQGLCDSVWLNYWQAFDKILPIEENFAGTFIGDIRSFKFYTCPLQYSEIKNNSLYEMEL